MSVAGQLELKLPPEPSSVARARSHVLDALADDVDGSQLETVRLLISELVTNAVRHGSNGRAPIELHAHWNSMVRVEVIDHGHGFTPAPRNAGHDEPGGYGLFLVGTLADRWGVSTNDCTTVWFELETV